MRGIQYINDNNGNRVKVVVDLTRYGREFAVFLEALANNYEAADNNTTPTNTVTGDNIA